MPPSRVLAVHWPAGPHGLNKLGRSQEFVTKMDKALAVLSADQKQVWKETTGEAFSARFQDFPVFRRPNAG